MPTSLASAFVRPRATVTDAAAIPARAITQTNKTLGGEPPAACGAGSTEIVAVAASRPGCRQDVDGTSQARHARPRTAGRG